MTKRRSVHHERGAGTVLALGVIAVVLAAAALALLLAGALVARHRAGAAADLAALAAASHVPQGVAAACRAADVVARANGARLTGCSLDGRVAEVRVQIPLHGPLARWRASGRARAGPAGESGGN